MARVARLSDALGLGRLVAFFAAAGFFTGSFFLVRVLADATGFLEAGDLRAAGFFFIPLVWPASSARLYTGFTTLAQQRLQLFGDLIVRL